MLRVRTVKRSRILVVGVLVGACAPARHAPPEPEAAECYALWYPSADARGRVAGDTLVLSTLRLPAYWRELTGQDGHRAFFGIAAWRDPPPVQPPSYFWRAPAADSVWVGYVLPLASSVYGARRTEFGLVGTSVWSSDVVGEPVRRRPFTGERIRCPDRSDPEPGA